MRSIAALLIAMSCLQAAAAECTVRSGSATNALLELYTSEGCDSCPPADRWLSRLPATGSVVPLAFHVDYWDYLGWKDRFGDPRFAERQRALAAAARSTRVYTPQVMVAGRDLHSWRDEAHFARTVGAVAAKPARASVSIASSAPAQGRLAATVTPQLSPGESAQDVATFLAVVESGHVSRVTAGENRGETLRHDHVVREFRMQAGVASFTSDLAWPTDRDPSRSALVAFVQNLRTGEVLQALRAPICRS